MKQQIDIKKILNEKGPIIKFGGIAPEGFILIHEKTLEDLKEFDNWKLWKNNELTIESLNKKNFVL